MNDIKNNNLKKNEDPGKFRIFVQRNTVRETNHLGISSGTRQEPKHPFMKESHFLAPVIYEYGEATNTS